MKNKHCMIIFGSLIAILAIIFLFKVLPDIAEGIKNQQIEEQRIEFDICLQGCKFYEDAIPYINNTKITHFDFCANDCDNEYLKEG